MSFDNLLGFVSQSNRTGYEMAIEAAIEDVAFARAIEEGEATELVQRKEVFKLLEGNKNLLDRIRETIEHIEKTQNLQDTANLKKLNAGT